jgi:hypothetical protein
VSMPNPVHEGARQKIAHARFPRLNLALTHIHTCCSTRYWVGPVLGAVLAWCLYQVSYEDSQTQLDTAADADADIRRHPDINVDDHGHSSTLENGRGGGMAVSSERSRTLRTSTSLRCCGINLGYFSRALGTPSSVEFASSFFFTLTAALLATAEDSFSRNISPLAVGAMQV